MKLNRNHLFGNKFINIREGDLLLANEKVTDLAVRQRTPTFIFLLEKIRENILYIQTVMTEVFPQSQGFYSLKSNFLTPAVQTVNEMGFGAEIVSHLEFRLVKRLGFPNDAIMAGGPFLSDEFLKDLLQYQVKYMVIYDLEDLPRICEILHQIHLSNEKNHNNKYRPIILLRFRTQKYTSRHGIPNTKASFYRIKEIFNSTDLIEFGGILSHFGTRLKSKQQYLENTHNILDIILNLRMIASLSPKYINFGGGFPSADAIKKSEFKAMLLEVQDLFSTNGLSDITFLYEPGRFIIEDTGFCLCRIIRFDQDTRTAFVDIGNNFIPKFMKSSLRFYNASRILDSSNEPTDIMGCIPSDQDILIKNYNFTAIIEKGDVILISNVGAYALTWSTRFPYARPKIIIIDGKDHHVVFERDDQNDFALS